MNALSISLFRYIMIFLLISAFSVFSVCRICRICIYDTVCNKAIKYQHPFDGGIIHNQYVITVRQPIIKVKPI